MRKEIPWEYTQNPTLRVWRWLTPHFDAIVRSDGNRFVYSVTDRTRGMRLPLVNDYATSFKDAEESVLEVVGKAYPPGAGYRDYAGELATTFAIATGERIDFGPLEGTRVTLVVNMDNGEQKSITGPLNVSHYKILIRDEAGDRYTIPSQRIASVQSDEKRRPDRVPHGQSRTVPGSVKEGCTGQPSFSAGKVDHPASVPWCPVHRV